MRSYAALLFFSSRRRHTRWPRAWSSDVCSSDLQHRGDRRHHRKVHAPSIRHPATPRTELAGTWPGPPGPGHAEVAGSGGGGSPEVGPLPHTPPWRPRWGPARRWLGRSLLRAACRLRPGAVGGELLQQRRELSLDLDDLAGLTELGGQALVLPPQPGVLPLHRVGRRASLRRGQRRQRPPVALLAPFGDPRGVQALPAQQRALAGLVQPLVLGQDLGLVASRVGPRPGPLRDLRVWWLLVVHPISMHANATAWFLVDATGSLLPRPLGSMIQCYHLPDQRLTQRGRGSPARGGG